jgi:hypothetical protein
MRLVPQWTARSQREYHALRRLPGTYFTACAWLVFQVQRADTRCPNAVKRLSALQRRSVSVAARGGVGAIPR